MHLGKLGYYADFLIHPMVVLAGIALLVLQGGIRQRLIGLAAAAVGLIVWTILEYAVHRGLFHGAGRLARMHGIHHRKPHDRFGTPSGASLAILVLGVFLPGCLLFGEAAGIGLTIGLSSGFFWYIAVHHAIHYWPSPRSRYLRLVSQHHAGHHKAGRQGGNFGVTTPFWDLMMNSALPGSGTEPVARLRT